MDPKKRRKVLSAAAVIIAVIAGYFGYQQLTYVTTDDAQIEGHALLLAPKVGGYIKNGFG